MLFNLYPTKVIKKLGLPYISSIYKPIHDHRWVHILLKMTLTGQFGGCLVGGLKFCSILLQLCALNSGLSLWSQIIALTYN